MRRSDSVMTSRETGTWEEVRLKIVHTIKYSNISLLGRLKPLHRWKLFKPVCAQPRDSFSRLTTKWLSMVGSLLGRSAALRAAAGSTIGTASAIPMRCYCERCCGSQTRAPRTFVKLGHSFQCLTIVRNVSTSSFNSKSNRRCLARCGSAIFVFPSGDFAPSRLPP